MYNQAMYPEPVESRHIYTRKFCGCMSLKAGCFLASAIWMGTNLYGAVLSFQYRSPFFSHLNQIALIVQGVICVAFCIVALYTVFAVMSDMPLVLHSAHRVMWCMVSLFTTNLFVDMVLFGVQRPEFESWCTQRSRGGLADQLNATVLEQSDDANVYNCSKLWEDELKFSVVIFIMITICFVYWATCLWSYSQKQQQLATFTTYEIPFHPGAVGPPLRVPAGVMRNLGTSGTAKDTSIGKGRSLAEASRHLASQVYSFFGSRKSTAPDPTEKPHIPAQ